MDKRACATCDKPIRGHFNRKRCRPCSRALVLRPKSSLTQEQIQQVRAWIGKIPVTEMAERLGTSVSNIKRAFRGESIWYHNGKYKNRPELVAAVLHYYAKNGKLKTIERFPDVSVKSIVDRPEFYGFEKPRRQVRWTDEQLAEAARMAGLISFKAQAGYFRRPSANEGSIRSLWSKRFKQGWAQLNGMAWIHAHHLVDGRARYIRPQGTGRNWAKTMAAARIILWVDMEKALKPELPPFIREAVKTMADFQRWLWRSDNPRPLILKMIKVREQPA